MTKIKRKNIPNCLRKYRKIRGLKQSEVAKILGLKSTSIISRWETGSCLPSSLNIFKLSILYHALADALFIDQVRLIRSDIYRKEQLVRKLNPCPIEMTKLKSDFAATRRGGSIYKAKPSLVPSQRQLLLFTCASP